ncbi:MAG: hypothetical protein JXO48_02465 [Deltaproteobacteria bacterium]|nr:hypothetical protein [Deltaproteobacteria bacterium]
METFHDTAERPLTNRLGWLMFFRVVIVSVLLGISAYIQLKGTVSASVTLQYFLYIIIAATYILSILYVFMSRIVRSIAFNVYIQSVVDVLLITALVFVTGGIDSMYATLYPMVIIYTVLFIERRGGILVATLCSVLYGLLLEMEFFGFISPIYTEVRPYAFSAGSVFSRILANVVSFYIIAFLASFVVEQEKRMRALLSERESAFDNLDLLHRSIIESVNSGIITTDLAGNIKSFNKAAEVICSRSLGGYKDRPMNSLFPDITEQMNGEVKNFEFTYMTEDWKRMILGFSMHPLVDSSGSEIGRILIFEDLTTIKEMEHEVERNKRLALIGEMTAVLAHELRTPLASIGGSVELLKRDLRLDGTDRRLMDIILRGKDQVEGLVRDFLLLARPQEGNYTEIDIREMLTNIVESVQVNPDWHDDITITCSFADSNTLRGNQLEIRQALWNLVINSIQALHDGGTLSLKTEIIADARNRELLEISVTDTGCGIEEQHMDRILEPFFTTKEMGTGLGLAIVNRIVKSHSGTFTVMSRPNEGTRCSILLPLNEHGR